MAISSSEAAPTEEEAWCGGGSVALGAAWRGSGGGSTEAAAWLGARIQQHRPGSPEHRRHSMESGLPLGQAEAGEPRTAKTLLPQAEQSSGPAPRSLKALQARCFRVPVGGESRFPELATTTVVVPPGATRGKQPPLSPVPDRGQSRSPKCQHLKISPTVTSKRNKVQGKSRDLKYTESEETPRGVCLFV